MQLITNDVYIHSVSLNLTAQHCEANTARRRTLSPSHTSSRTRDCRWKRGRPVVFAGRAFSTKQADLITQECAVTEISPASGIARQASEQRVTVPLHQPSQHSEECSNTAACGDQHMSGEGASSQFCHSVPVQTGRAIDLVSSKGSPTTVASAPTTDTQDAGCDNQSDRNSSLEPDVQLASLKDNTTDDVMDTDYTPNSTNESGIQSEKGGLESVKQPTETHTPLDFQIPKDVLRAAMTAPDNTKASFWSSNLYRGPEDKKVLVHYCKTKEVAERVAQYFVGEKVVGFDIEWKPWVHPLSIKKNVSLIQLACEDRIALFHVALFTEQTAAQLMPPTLKAILESPEVYKVGVAVKGDFSRIVKFLDVEPQGVFELSRLYNLVEYSVADPSKVSNKLVGLAAQVQRHLQLPLYKGGDLADDPEDTYNVRSSDWSLPLNHQQIHYAAADAYAGFRLYDVLEEKRKQLKPVPPRPLLCDYDSKPKPRTSGSKPRKKRPVIAKTDEVETPVEEEAYVMAEPEEQGERGEQLEVELKRSQDTEGYETAQEDLLDSHQLEGEDLAPSEQSYESTEESVDDVSIDSALWLEQEEKAALAVTSQRRIGRINFSWLKGPDPGYPTLPNLPDGDETLTPSDEDLVDILEKPEEDNPEQIVRQAEVPEVEEGTDEFDDPELEEALQNLDIDGTRNLKSLTEHYAAAQPHTNPDFQGAEMSISVPTEIEDDKRYGNRDEKQVPKFEPNNSTSDEQEKQQLRGILNDPHVDEDLHSATLAPPSTDHPTSSHTPEYDLATTWAQSYLTATIPSPTSRAPSHIRATIPHLRAYNMWHHQGLSLGEVARHLRDPPLAESTVKGYVLQAITLERMVFDKEKVRGVLMGMPEALRRGKWKGLAEKVGAR